MWCHVMPLLLLVLLVLLPVPRVHGVGAAAIILLHMQRERLQREAAAAATTTEDADCTAGELRGDTRTDGLRFQKCIDITDEQANQIIDDHQYLLRHQQ